MTTNLMSQLLGGGTSQIAHVGNTAATHLILISESGSPSALNALIICGSSPGYPSDRSADYQPRILCLLICLAGPAAPATGGNRYPFGQHEFARAAPLNFGCDVVFPFPMLHVFQNRGCFSPGCHVARFCDCRVLSIKADRTRSLAFLGSVRTPLEPPLDSGLFQQCWLSVRQNHSKNPQPWPICSRLAVVPLPLPATRGDIPCRQSLVSYLMHIGVGQIYYSSSGCDAWCMG